MQYFPTWYWTKGLHDAVIRKISFRTLDYDYRQARPIRNYLIMELDSRNALFDTEIVAIKFYNAKVVAGDTDICGYWWLNDELSCEVKKYTLTIHVAKKKGENILLQISFDSAEVLRKP